MKVFRSPGSRGPQSDLVLLPQKQGGLGSFSSFCKAVYTTASIEKFVNSSIEPETHHFAYFGDNFLIAATVTEGSLQNGLMQDLYFERKMVEFSEP